MSSSIASEANDYSGRSGFSMLAWPIDINNAYPYMDEVLMEGVGFGWRELI